MVDDDGSVRRALRTQLQILGFNVLDFPSAEEFLVSEFPTGDACLLLDVYMAGMNGVELCRGLHGQCSEQHQMRFRMRERETLGRRDIPPFISVCGCPSATEFPSSRYLLA